MNPTAKYSKITIIGGGICGLSVAFALHIRGYHNIHLLEAHNWPNALGSSHSHSRITRSAYSSPFYVSLMKEAHEKYWPLLSQHLKKKLLHPCPGIFFGPHTGLIQSYADAVRAVDAHVEPITITAAREQFPQFFFHQDDLVLLDHTAGVLAAEDTILGLVAYLKEKGVSIYEKTPITHIDNEENPHTHQGVFPTDVLISCAGPWTPKLFPILSTQLLPMRQRVFYMKARKGWKIGIPDFPVWVEVGHTLAENWYGLPEFGSTGFKLARHRLTGDIDDPDATPIILEEHRSEAIEKALSRFPCTEGFIEKEEHCIYTMRQNEDYLIDRISSKTIVASGFSGHGFKLAPLCGDRIVDIMEGKDTLLPFRIS